MDKIAVAYGDPMLRMLRIGRKNRSSAPGHNQTVVLKVGDRSPGFAQNNSIDCTVCICSQERCINQNNVEATPECFVVEH